MSDAVAGGLPVRVAALRWVAGLYFVLLGASLILLPASDAVAATPAAAQGTVSVLSGFALLWLAALSPAPRLRRPLHLLIALLQAGIAINYIAEGVFTPAATLLLFAAAIAAAAFVTEEKPGSGPRPDALGLVLGGVMVAQGLDIVLRPTAASVATTLDLPAAATGAALLAGGSAVVLAQLRPRAPRPLVWAAHLLGGGVVLALTLALPLLVSPIYWFLGAAGLLRGVATIVLPWWSARAERLDGASLRPRLAVALVTATVVPLLVALDLVVDQVDGPTAAATRLMAFGVTVVVLALAATVGWWLAGQLVAPLTTLARAVSVVATGGAAALPRTGPSEVRHLAGSVEQMAADLRAQADELRAADAHRAALINQTLTGIAEADAGGWFTFVNDRYCAITGYERAELVGRLRMHELAHPDDRPGHARAFCRLVDEGVPFAVETRVLRRDGRVVWVSNNVSAVRDAAGHVRSTVAVMVDVTARRRAEAERERLLAGERAARAEAEAALRTRDELVSFITHDLRTPLTTVQGYTQMLGRQAARTDALPSGLVVDGLDRIDAGVKRITAMLRDLTDTAQLQTGQPVVLARAPTDLAALARRCLDACRSTAPAHRLTLHAAVAPLVGEWDAARLERVLENLLGNSVKYSPGGGPVTVTLRREPPPADDGVAAPHGWAVVEVRDEGIGIPAADLPHAFERFRRGGNVGGIQGTGIGLAGVKQIVEQHGGTVTVASVEGEGSTFTVRLPLAA